jgi:hypothetical protein
MAALVATSACLPGHAESTFEKLAPSAVFFQTGVAENNAQSLVVGLSWDWSWSKEYSFGTVTGYHEASFGRWTAEKSEPRASRWATQLGITPTLRINPTWLDKSWFLEFGVGANVIVPIYRNRSKSFSTEFNFGDHVGLGWRSGDRSSRELVLRFQHFSNGGIEHPNPGENFFQVRYSHQF